jgi:tripartite-type tricarboxylate transporter receptor subunit TctC
LSLTNLSTKRQRIAKLARTIRGVASHLRDFLDRRVTDGVNDTFRERSSSMKNRKREICTSGSVRDEEGHPPHLLGRRRFLRLAAGAAALPTISRTAGAQAYPTRPVRIVVPAAAAGALDIAARLLGQWLSERLGQPFVIENRPGAGTNIGTEAVVRSPPDGYTLLLIALSNAVNATLYDKLNFDFVRDIAPVAGFMRYTNAMVVHPSFPANSVPEFIAYARANPGKINIASGGIGTAGHVSGELFMMMTRTKMTHVPYRGGAPAIADLLGGQVQIYFSTIPSAIEYIKVGTLRPLAVTTNTRSAILPNIPSIAEFVPGYEASGWQGLGTPKDTPAEVIDKLNKEINAALADRKMRARLADLGGTPLPGSPADFGKFIADETEKWAKVIQAANIKGE